MWGDTAGFRDLRRGSGVPICVLLEQSPGRVPTPPVPCTGETSRMTDLIVKDVDDALVERITAFAAAQVPLAPYAAAEGFAAPADPDAPLLLTDAEWVSLQGICRL